MANNDTFAGILWQRLPGEGQAFSYDFADPVFEVHVIPDPTSVLLWASRPSIRVRGGYQPVWVASNEFAVHQYLLDGLLALSSHLLPAAAGNVAESRVSVAQLTPTFRYRAPFYRTQRSHQQEDPPGTQS